MPVRIDVVDGENQETSTDKSDEINGQVAFVGAVADPQTGNFPVRILIDNAEGRLRVGQVVQGDHQAADRAIGDRGPAGGRFRPGRRADRGRRARRQDQAAPSRSWAPSDGGFVAVTKTDLHEGEMVVTDGAYSVKDGTDATIAPAAAAEPVKGTETAKAGEPAKGGEHE